MNVSIAMKPLVSPCPPTEVRWMSPSPDAQMPIVYHFVSRPDPRACISVRIHVPAGVDAFHDATSSSNPPTPMRTSVHVEVHEPLWYAIAPRSGMSKGSSYEPA